MNDTTITDKEKQVFLYGLAKLCLQRLNVRFTDTFLKDVIVQAYQSTLETSYTDTEKENKVSVADRDDASNLAIVLLDALRKYHIKNEVCTEPVIEKNTLTLLILSRKDEKQDYRQLLKVMDDGSGQTKHDFKKEEVENYVTLKTSKFTGEPDYILNRNREGIKKASVIAVSILLSFTLGLSIYHGFANYKFILWAPLLVLLVSGGIVCYHLFKLEKTNTYASSLLKKICTNEKNNFGCKQVISSAGSKLFGIISQTDIGIVYFSSMFSFALAGLLSNNYNDHLSLLFWGSALPLPYTVFSVYYQLRVIKKICILCMITQALLWIQFLYFILILPEINITAIHPEYLIRFTLLLTTFSILYFLFIQNKKINEHINLLSSENLKFKNTEAMFDDAMAGQQKFIDPVFPTTLALGNPSAKIKLNAILSLSCAPCANKLKDLLKLDDWFENAICINILLKTDAHSATVLKNMIAHTQNGRTEQAKSLLSGWYDFFIKSKEKGVKNLADIAAAWERENPSATWTESVEAVYALHEQCYKTHPVPFTPLVEYNDQLLASPYDDTELLSNRIEQHLE